MRFRLFGRSGGLNEGGQNELSISPNGEAIVRPFNYSEAVFQNLDATATAYNFQKPLHKSQFVITAIVAFANRNVTTQTQVDIYEATTASTTTVAKQIRRLDVAKLANHIETGLLTRISSGMFLNAKCDDDDVFLTIDGYFVPEEV